MMTLWQTVLFPILILFQDITSLRLLELRVPAHVAEGCDVLLACVFDLGEDQLFLVKWSKDNNEFYRYHENGTQYFPVQGVNVDMSRSSRDTVWLKNVTHDTAGSYTCEVVGETPLFPIVAESRDIGVHLLPKSQPIITGEQDHYRVGDVAILNCTSSPSRPETQLKWWMNDRPVLPTYVHGPWVRAAPNRPNATITKLQLIFRVTSSHFQQGVMRLKCEATIAPIYNQETNVAARSSLLEPILDNNSEHFSEGSATVKPGDFFDDPDNERPPYVVVSQVNNKDDGIDSSAVQQTKPLILSIELLFIINLFQLV